MRCAVLDRVCSAKRTGRHCCGRQRRLPGKFANPPSAKATASRLPDAIARPSPRYMGHPRIRSLLRFRPYPASHWSSRCSWRHPSIAVGIRHLSPVGGASFVQECMTERNSWKPSRGRPQTRIDRLRAATPILRHGHTNCGHTRQKALRTQHALVTRVVRRCGSPCNTDMGLD